MILVECGCGNEREMEYTTEEGNCDTYKSTKGSNLIFLNVWRINCNSFLFRCHPGEVEMMVSVSIVLLCCINGFSTSLCMVTLSASNTNIFELFL